MKKLALIMILCSVCLMGRSQPDKVYTRISEIKDPLKVYHLEMRYDRLRRIPPIVFECTNLRSLNLSKNFIDTLPPEIGRLVNLEELNLQRNRIRSVPPEIGQLARLRILNISRNPILELPDAMGNLTSLEVLTLWMTGVVSLPPTFVALNHSLKTLDMRACPLTYDDQEAIETLLPGPVKRWDYVCNCK